MSLKKVKLLLAISQVGSIWSRNWKEVKVFKTLTAIGFLALFLNTDEEERKKEDINQYNKTL